MAAPALLRQFSFRYRNDDGGELSATWKGEINEQIPTMVTGDEFRVRMGIEEYAGNISRNAVLVPLFSINGGDWGEIINNAGSPFVLLNSSFYVGPANTNQQITTGPFSTGSIIELSGGLDTQDIDPNTFTENEVFLLLDPDRYGSIYQDGDIIEIGYALADGLFDEYVEVPTFEVAPLTQFSKIYLGGTKINNMNLGNDSVTHVYLGSNEVFRNI